jgi:hypothetical protein
MASPLGQVVFKVPELGQQGYKLELAEQARQEKKSKERESELYRTGGEKAYSDNIYKLQGRYKEDADAYFSEMQKYGEQYKLTGDTSFLRKATEIGQKLRGVISDYNTQVGIPLQEAAKADAVGWEGYVGDRDSFDQKIAEVISSKNTKVKDGEVYYEINGKYVPRNQTPYGDNKPNAVNTVMVQKASKMGQNVLPTYFESQNKFLAINAESIDEAQSSILNAFLFEIEGNPDLQADVAVAYALGKEGRFKQYGNKIPADEMAKVVNMFVNNETYRNQAMTWYTGQLKQVAANRWQSSHQTGGFGMVGGEDKEAPAESKTEEKTQSQASFIPDIKFPSGKTAERKIETSRSGQEPAPVQGPPSVEDEVVRIANEVGETKLEEVPEDMETPAVMEGQSVQGKGTPEDPQSYKNRGVIPAAPKAKEGVPMPVQSKEVPTKSAKAYYTPVEDLTWTPQTVKKAMDRWNTDIPVPYEDFIYVSNKYGIPVELIIAMAAKEGNIGVGERQVKTKNFFNWGNTTAGDTLKGKEQDKYNRYFSTWRDGLEVWADGMVRLYRPEDGDWSALWSEEGAFVNKDGKRYAADKNYEKSIRDIINGSLPRQLGDNYIAAR